MNEPNAAASATSAGARRPRVAGLAAAVVVAAVVAVVVVLVLVLGGGGSGAPANAATKLVPADALVYVHVSTDTGRGATKDALAIARRFGEFGPARAALLRRLSAPGCGIDVATLKGGREAALALLPGAGTTAGSLVLVDTGTDKALRERTCGQVVVAKIGRFLAIGQTETIAIARRLAAGKGHPLSADPLYRRATAALPERRVADAWATQAGVRRLLAPQPGLLGAAGVLLDQPGLRGVAAGLTAEGSHAARLTLRSELVAGAAPRQFTATVQRDVPAGAVAYLGVRGLAGAATKLLPVLGGTGAAQIAPLLARAGKDLAPLGRIFGGEVGVAITRAAPAPVLTVIAHTADPARAGRDLASVRPVLARLLKPAAGPAPAWRRVGDAWQLRPAAGIEFDYAVTGSPARVIASTRLAGIRAVESRVQRLPGTAAWKATAGNAPDRVSSLVFLDFSQLLRLGEQTGLNDNATYRSAESDLRKVRSVGAWSSGAGDETTTELLLSIP